MPSVSSDDNEICTRGVEEVLRVIVGKNQRNHGHGQKIDFAHTLSV